MEKTIKYLENGEYHYATVRSVGDLAQLKTDSKETLVEAINELWNGGGNADLSKAPKPEGYDQLVQDVADAVKNQQEISQQWIEWQNQEAQLTEERKQAYLQAMKEMQEAIDKAKADAAALDDKTTKLDEQITKTFSDLDTSIQNMHEQLQKEADRMDQELIDTKSDLTKVRTDLQNAQLDNGRIHDELTNINGKFEHKVWQTDLDPLKEQIDRAETSVQQTKDELLGKASRQDLDTVTNTVSKLDTQLKETAKGVEISVKKDELGGEIAEALTNKTNILLGTRRFTTNNWTQRDHVEICSGPWKGFLVAKQNSPIEGIQQAYDVKAGTTYTFSLFAKMDTLDDSNKPQIILAKNNLDTSLDTKIDVWRKEIEDITSDFKRYDLTFTPSEDCTIYPHVISNSNNPIFVCGYQLEIGKELTPWEPNQEDVGDYVEKSEAQFNVYNDRIQALTEKQRQQGDTQEKLKTEVTQTAEGTRQVSENLKKTNDDITKLRGEFEVKADHMKSEYESYTNKAVGQISDSTLNLIRNSSFQNKDSDFDQWQNVSAKANVRSDENGLRWVELTQSGLTTNNPEGITSNYFNIKQGKVTVAVDIKSGDKASLDNDSVLSLELYNDVKKRVDFYDVSLSQLGLSKELLGDHKVHRGLYRLGIDRNDAKYMTVKAKLVKNGDLYFTNFSARLSSIDDGAYEPNPDDLNQQILKQNTKIEQNAKEVAIKANSVDVTRDIKSAVDNVQIGGVNLVENGDANANNAFPWPHTQFQNHIFYHRGTKKMFNLHTASKNELVADNDRWFPIEAGQQYTLSFKGFMSGNVVSYDVWLLGKKIGVDEGWTNSFPIISWQRLSNSHCETITKTFTAPSDWNNFEAYLRFDNNGSSDGNDSVFFFNEVKLEKGNKATSYSPAPGDTSKEIKSAKDAAIKVASDQINIHVNEISTQFDDKLNKRINEQKTASEKFTSDGIEQVVTKVTNVKNDVDSVNSKLDNLQVGTRNLLHHSDTFDGWHKGSSVSISSEKYLNGSVAILNNSGSGVTALDSVLDVTNDEKYVTWTVYARADNNGDKLHTELWGGGGVTDQPLTTEWQRYKFEGNHADSNHSFYLWGVNTNKGNIYVALPFAVIGNTIGSWSPNPDDINQTIKDATEYKAVTGTIDFNNLKTQQKIFYKDLQAANAPAGGNYWYYLDVEPGYDGRILQTAISDRDNITWVRTFVDNWSPWVKQADQRNVDDLNNQINDFKTKTTASVKNLGDRVTTEVNSITSKVTNVNDKLDNLSVGGRNYISPKNVKGHYAHEPQYNASTQEWTVAIDNRTGGAWGGGICFQDTNIVVPWGQAYTDSVEVYVTDPNLTWNVDINNVPVVGNAWSGNDNDNRSALTVSPALNSVIPTNQWYRLSATAWNTDPKNTNHVGINDFSGFGIINKTGHTITVKFRRPKQELGSKATDWSPNPDDTVEAIKEINTKWDVANGQIQGKVTATDVNNILNGKGYATQSWAQTMFQMKSDSITLQAVRDNITNGIQNQVNDTRNQVKGLQNQFNTQTGINLLKGTADFSGPWFNKNGKGWSCNGEWQPPTSENKSERNNNVVYQDSGHAWDGLGQTVELNTGEYTFSMWMWPTLSGNESMNIYVGDSQYGGTAKVNYSGYSYSASQPQNRWILVKTYLTVTQGGKLSIRPELNQASGTIHVASYMLQHGHVENPVWAPAPDDLAPKSIISSINITPDQIKIASNKIVIDGNTDIHGVLRVPEVRLQGKSGMIGLDGNKGIIISSADTLFQTRVTKFGMDFLTTTNGQKEIMGGITTGFSTNNGNLNGISIVLDTQQKLGYPYGGDFFSIGNTTSIVNDDNRSWNRAMDYDASGQLHQGGFMWYEKSYLTGEGQNIYVGGVRGNGNSAYDPLQLGTAKFAKSVQPDKSQPTISLGYYGGGSSKAGLGFVWDQMKPYGNWDITDVNDIWYDGQHFRFTWVSHPEMMSNASCPSFVKLDDNGAISSGICFAWGSVWAMGAARGGNIVKLLL